ncbi:hypothetical protein ACFSQ7_15595 [Paenibacillus rhizoplanae]
MATGDNFSLPHFSVVFTSSSGTTIRPFVLNTNEFVVDAGNYLILYQANVLSSDTRAAGLELKINNNPESTSIVTAAINTVPSIVNGTYILEAQDTTTIQLALVYEGTAVTVDMDGVYYGFFPAKVTIIQLS